MANTIIITDSASDISSESEQRYANTLRILPYQVIFDDRAYASRVDFDNEQFYEMLAAYDGIPSTSQITEFQFEELYGELSAAGHTDAILVLINAQASATFNNALMARQVFFEKRPELVDTFRVHLIDGVTYTGAYGYAVLEAARMAERGVPAGEIIRFVQDWVSRCVIYFGMHTLKYAAKSGRIPSAAAFVGEALGLKPIMRIFDHEIVTAGKIRGERRLIPALQERTCAEIEPGTPYCVAYGSDHLARDSMAAAMTEALGYPPVDFYQIGAAIASNCGPRAVGVIFRAKEAFCRKE